MKRKELTRRAAALCWLAAFAVLAVFLCITGIYCVTPEQALRKMMQENDLGELQVMETLDGQMLEGKYGAGYHKAYILQNSGLTCMAVTTYDWYYGWQAGIPFYGLQGEVMEHGKQETVPVDFIWSDLEAEIKDGSSFVKQHVLGIILDSRVETVELSFGKRGDGDVWEEVERVTLNREDWGEGLYHDYFFYLSDSLEFGHWPKLRALDRNGNPITWTNTAGEQVEWYSSNWSDEFYEDWVNHMNGERH